MNNPTSIIVKAVIAETKSLIDPNATQELGTYSVIDNELGLHSEGHATVQQAYAYAKSLKEDRVNCSIKIYTIADLRKGV